MTVSTIHTNPENTSSVVSNITEEPVSISDDTTSIIEKKRKIEAVYSSGQWKDEDEYEVAKIRQVIRNHIFKHVKFVKGEGGKPCLNNTNQPNRKKILQYGKCHEKADLTKQSGYECQIIQLVGMNEGNSTITQRALWWKTYNTYIHHEIRQLRGRMNAAMKSSISQGKVTYQLSLS